MKVKKRQDKRQYFKAVIKLLKIVGSTIWCSPTYTFFALLLQDKN